MLHCNVEGRKLLKAKFGPCAVVRRQKEQETGTSWDLLAYASRIRMSKENELNKRQEKGGFQPQNKYNRELL